MVTIPLRAHSEFREGEALEEMAYHFGRLGISLLAEISNVTCDGKWIDGLLLPERLLDL
jgi:hypothetical protein